MKHTKQKNKNTYVNYCRVFVVTHELADTRRPLPKVEHLLQRVSHGGMESGSRTVNQRQQIIVERQLLFDVTTTKEMKEKSVFRQ